MYLFLNKKPLISVGKGYTVAQKKCGRQLYRYNKCRNRNNPHNGKDKRRQIEFALYPFGSYQAVSSKIFTENGGVTAGCANAENGAQLYTALYDKGRQAYKNG